MTALTNGQPYPSDTRYYDTYAYSKNTENYQRRILGDAMGETGPFATATYELKQKQISSWYADEAWLVNGYRIVLS